MQPIRVRFENNFAVNLYDMSITDLKERAEKKQRFESCKKAAQFLGYSSSASITAEMMNPGRYAYCQKTNKQYAIRIAK